jgi:Ca-activated chloride channel family protein
MTLTRSLPFLTETVPPDQRHAEDAGFGALTTGRGCLPLEALDVRGRIDGLLAQVTVRQTFVNATAEPLEATYIFPLPDRAAVTAFRMEVAGRIVEAALRERARARREYAEAIQRGHRASIAEEERPGVFTMRVGNLMPGERATVELTLAGTLPYADGEVTFRFPLVVAPRYIPGLPLPGPSVGAGVALDTHAVPDASRITPPVLLPGYPNPVRLSLAVELHETGAPADDVRVSLHAVWEDDAPSAGVRRVVLQPGARLDRDFILRFRLGGPAAQTALSLHPDAERNEQLEGTFALTIVPPIATGPGAGVGGSRPRDVALVLDRSGSMEGWKIVAARRAAARIVDTLTDADRFAVIAFDVRIETPERGELTLIPGTDRNRFRCVEFLAGLKARGGTEIAGALDRAVRLFDESSGERTGASPRRAGSERILVLVTDGQVGNEDEVLRVIAPRLEGVRVFTLGIDQAVNEGFLHRLAGMGASGGSCELVESEDRLDAVMESIHRHIGTPLLTDVQLLPGANGLRLAADSLVPDRLPCLFAGSPLLILGRYQGLPRGPLVVRGQAPNGTTWQEVVAPAVRDNPAITAAWARGRVRQLEDHYAAGPADVQGLEKSIIATSLRYGVLCRFTAYVAVDRSAVVNEGGEVHYITQPVEMPSGWEMDAQRSIAARCLAAPHAVGYAAGPSLSAAVSGGDACAAPVESFLREFACHAPEPPRPRAGLVPLPAPPPPSALYLAPEEQLEQLGYTPSGLLEHDEYGTVYEAFDSRGRPVRMRILKSPACPCGSLTVAALRKTLLALHHRAILRVVDLVPEPVSPGRAIALVSESRPGQRLSVWVPQSGPSDPRDAAAILLLLAEALEYAAARGVIHGLLSPTNILIAQDGSPLIADFGLTQLGFGPPASEREVIQSLGAVFHLLLTGALPAGETAGGASRQPAALPQGRREFWKAPGEAPDAASIAHALPAELEAIYRKATATDPAPRYTSLAELSADLRRFLGVKRRGFLGRFRGEKR